MKKFLVLAAVTAPAFIHAESRVPADRPFFKTTPPPVYEVKTDTTAPTAVTQPYVYDQKPMGIAPAPLVTREQADEVVNKFKTAYSKLGSPRIVVYVNRELIDSESGTRLTSRSETIDTTRSKVNSTIDSSAHAAGVTNINASESPGKGKLSRKTDNIHTENRYSTKDQKTQPLADKQTVRDVERLFGRPLRAGGASLADQHVAAQLIANRPIKQMLANTEGDQAQKDREALKGIADVVIEVLISSRNITVSEVSGDKTYTSPDIQATAIRLSDSRIVGQAASRDVVGRAGSMAHNYDVQEITEATALALMDDMTLGQK